MDMPANLGLYGGGGGGSPVSLQVKSDCFGKSMTSSTASINITWWRRGGNHLLTEREQPLLFECGNHGTARSRTGEEEVYRRTTALPSTHTQSQTPPQTCTSTETQTPQQTQSAHWSAAHGHVRICRMKREVEKVASVRCFSLPNLSSLSQVLQTHLC